MKIDENLLRYILGCPTARVGLIQVLSVGWHRIGELGSDTSISLL
jgi:hypothetical protein